MTYRTFDTDTNLAGGPSAPVRHLRARRRATALRSRIVGVTINGFGG